MRYAGIHHSKYWMPIDYDTIEDGQNKNLIFYSLSKVIIAYPHLPQITGSDYT